MTIMVLRLSEPGSLLEEARIAAEVHGIAPCPRPVPIPLLLIWSREAAAIQDLEEGVEALVCATFPSHRPLRKRKNTLPD